MQRLITVLLLIVVFAPIKSLSQSCEQMRAETIAHVANVNCKANEGCQTGDGWKVT